MRVKISGEGTTTHIEIDGVDWGKYASSFTLSQDAGDIPKLVLTIPAYRGLTVDIPDGAVVVEREVEKAGDADAVHGAE